MKKKNYLNFQGNIIKAFFKYLNILKMVVVKNHLVNEIINLLLGDF